MLIGCALWGLFAADVPLALFPALLEGAKWIARTAAQQPWDSVAELHQPDFWKEMDEVLTTNLRAPFSLCVQQLDPERAMMIFSDAKGSPEPTWAITSGDIVQSGRFTEWQAAHIFFHEFRAAGGGNNHLPSHP